MSTLSRYKQSGYEWMRITINSSRIQSTLSSTPTSHKKSINISHVTACKQDNGSENGDGDDIDVFFGQRVHKACLRPDVMGIQWIFMKFRRNFFTGWLDFSQSQDSIKGSNILGVDETMGTQLLSLRIDSVDAAHEGA